MKQSGGEISEIDVFLGIVVFTGGSSDLRRLITPQDKF